MAPIAMPRGIIFDCETIALGKSVSVPAPFRSARFPTIPYSLKLTRTTNSTAPTICSAPSDESRDDWTVGLSIGLAIFYICIIVLWIALNVRLSTNAEHWANERFMRLNLLLRPLTFNDWRAKWSRHREHRPKFVLSPIPLDPDCAICLNAVSTEDTIRELPCEHIFHQRCLDRWFGLGHDRCPICRSIYFDETLNYESCYETVFT